MTIETAANNLLQRGEIADRPVPNLVVPGTVFCATDDGYDQRQAVKFEILTSSIANPTVITTDGPHGMATGDEVLIAGHTGSTPAIDGTHTVTVTGDDTFTIAVNVTVDGTGGFGYSWVAYSGASGGGITQLTGDVTAGPGSGSVAATIANNAVTNAKLGGTVVLQSVKAIRGIAKQGVYSGCVVSEDSGGASLDVDVTAGHICFGVSDALVTAGSVTMAASDATNPRIDLVCVEDDGTKIAVTGSAAALPIAPAIPSDAVVIASVFRAANDDTISNSDITDERVIGYWPQIRRLASNETRTNDTQANVAGMSFSIAIGEEWEVRTILVYISASATPDIRWGFTGPANVVGMNGSQRITTGATTSTVGDGIWAASGTTPVGTASGGTTSDAFALNAADYRYWVCVDTPGVIQLQYAQNVTNANATTLFSHSHMVATPVILP